MDFISNGKYSSTLDKVKAPRCNSELHSLVLEKGLSFLRLPGNRGSFVVWPVGPPKKLVTWRSRVVTETRMFKFVNT